MYKRRMTIISSVLMFLVLASGNGCESFDDDKPDSTKRTRSDNSKNNQPIPEEPEEDLAAVMQRVEDVLAGKLDVDTWAASAKQVYDALQELLALDNKFINASRLDNKFINASRNATDHACNTVKARKYGIKELPDAIKQAVDCALLCLDAAPEYLGGIVRNEREEAKNKIMKAVEQIDKDIKQENAASQCLSATHVERNTRLLDCRRPQGETADANPIYEISMYEISMIVTNTIREMKKPYYVGKDSPSANTFPRSIAEEAWRIWTSEIYTIKEGCKFKEGTQEGQQKLLDTLARVSLLLIETLKAQEKLREEFYRAQSNLSL